MGRVPWAMTCAAHLLRLLLLCVYFILFFCDVCVQMLALKPSENGCAAALDQDLTRERKREDERGRERKREEETASGRSRWSNASTLPKTLPSVPLPPPSSPPPVLLFPSRVRTWNVYT